MRYQPESLVLPRKNHGTEKSGMFYDNIYVLSDLFYRFLLDNPDLQKARSYDERPDFVQRLEEWLEGETFITDLVHKTTLLQLASCYEAMVELRDTYTTSTGL
jgi:hypothetical protein